MIDSAGQPDAARRPWWFWLLAIDIGLVLITASNRYLPALGDHPLFGGGGGGDGWRLLEPFNLVREANPAAWWSGLALAAGGFLACDLFRRQAAPGTWVWGAVSAVLVGLSADELTSLHERVDTPGGWTPIAAVAALAFAFPLLAMLRDSASRSAALWIGSGFGLFAVVAVMEYIERLVDLPQGWKGPRAGLEEGLELAGQLLILFALVRERARLSSGDVKTWRAVVPRPSQLVGLRKWLTGLAVAHVAVVLWWVPGLRDIGVRGDPTCWLPFLIFGLLACKAWWEGNSSSPWRRGLLVTAFLVASMDSVSMLSRHALIVAPDLPARLFSGACNVGLLAALLLAALASLGGRSTASPRLSVAALAILAVAWGALVDSGALEGVIPALSAFALLMSWPPAVEATEGD
jgi:hypothetical protein